MAGIKLIKHLPGAPGMRWFGLGPGLKPTRSMNKLKTLLDKHAFWAKGRSYKKLRLLLAGSNVVVSLWRGKRMVGFGRATTDGICRAVLWDIVVAGDLQGLGLGRQVVEALLTSKSIRSVEHIYLMTTNEKDFYLQLGFTANQNQTLLEKINLHKSTF
ncbi:GNAT family N-acetyltransferase [Prochlorococcus sp. MIT 1300]|uniref:GNAT family N-acetyltransferase n=1 Tax=Prochlorococcus sp. MIT 1300 TaxID=3096218 RepID=UPI002A757B2A|nr:GNAT family N-acetyltransferase [Prochlorococcus sp. MIT 1300]